MLNIALQIDPPEGLNVALDTSLLLGREAQARGHRLYYLPPESVAQASDGEVSGTVSPLELFATDAKPFFKLGQPERISLDELDVVLVRQDPPFDMGYISNSLMLERLIEKGTLVLNHPMAVRNNPEKMLPFRFPEYSPPTLIAADIDAIRAFHKEHGAVVIKPAYGFGGHGIVKVNEDGENLEALLEMQLSASKEPLVVQQFLPDVKAEEKRIILIDGKLAGAYSRLPQGADIRANSRVGGGIAKTELSERQQAIAYDVGKLAEQTGLMLVGLDVIGDWLTEINITCPTGLMVLKELYGTQPEADFWNVVEGVIALRDKAMHDNSHLS